MTATKNEPESVAAENSKGKKKQKMRSELKKKADEILRPTGHIESRTYIAREKYWD